MNGREKLAAKNGDGDTMHTASTSSLLSPSFEEATRRRTSTKPLNLVSTLLGTCLCEPFQCGENRGLSPSTQFVELHGIRFIGLGAVVDELTPRERVYDTLEQLTTRTERLVSVGYLLDEAPSSTGNDNSSPQQQPPNKVTETIPLDVWNQNYPNDQNMSKQVKDTVDRINRKDFDVLISELSKTLAAQKAHPGRGNNRYMAGITAHNLGVVKVLAGRDKEAVSLFQEAIALKEAAFGKDKHEVALSWDELGIQFFAHGDFEGSLSAFREAHKLRRSDGHDGHPSVAMVLNNIACCNFQMGNHRTALLSLQEAREIQHKAIGSSAQADLDLLHVAVVICNCAYLNLSLKQYEEARSLLDEALLIQQSVLDMNHRAVRDTLSNLEFANAFHS